MPRKGDKFGNVRAVKPRRKRFQGNQHTLEEETGATSSAAKKTEIYGL